MIRLIASELSPKGLVQKNAGLTLILNQSKIPKKMNKKYTIISIKYFHKKLDKKSNGMIVQFCDGVLVIDYSFTRELFIRW